VAARGDGPGHLPPRPGRPGRRRGRLPGRLPGLPPPGGHDRPPGGSRRLAAQGRAAGRAPPAGASRPGGRRPRSNPGPRPPPPRVAAGKGAGAILDEEVPRLPKRQRAPFVLGYLEGKTVEEAAHSLGCPRGTVLSRLSRARDRLRAALTRRGVVPSAGALAAAVTPESGAAVPVPLVDATLKAGMQVAAAH